MYSIEKTDYGLHVTMGGRYTPEEIATYISEKERMMAEFTQPFCMLVDLRAAYPPDDADEQRLEESQMRMKSTHLLRAAVVVLSPVVRNQLQQMLLNSRLNDCVRIINASKYDHWEELAMKWILYGTEPPKADQAYPRLTSA